MSGYAENWNGYIALKQQSAKGTPATGSGAIILPSAGGQGGQLSKNAVTSALVRQDGQQYRGRHGSRRTTGTYASESASAAPIRFGKRCFALRGRRQTSLSRRRT